MYLLCRGGIALKSLPDEKSGHFLTRVCPLGCSLTPEEKINKRPKDPGLFPRPGTLKKFTVQQEVFTVPFYSAANSFFTALATLHHRHTEVYVPT
jgi:hypothetical protein